MNAFELTTEAARSPLARLETIHSQFLRDTALSMSQVETPFGHALPPFPQHSITLHVPSWATILQFVDNAQQAISRVKSLYPRFGPFAEVKDVRYTRLHG